MNFIVEQVLRAELMKLLGHAVPPSVANAHPEYVAVENAWIAEVMAYAQGKRKDLPMPPSWLLASAVMPEAAVVAEAVMGILRQHQAREAPSVPAPQAASGKPAEAKAPVSNAPTPSASAGQTVPSVSEGLTIPSVSEGLTIPSVSEGLTIPSVSEGKE